jgi:hypothetical protein
MPDLAHRSYLYIREQRKESLLSNPSKEMAYYAALLDCPLLKLTQDKAVNGPDLPQCLHYPLDTRCMLELCCFQPAAKTMPLKAERSLSV